MNEEKIFLLISEIMKNKKLGIIGFGPMAKNITFNLINKNFLISIYNREKIFLNKKIFNIVIITNSFKKFFKSINKKKIILILIKPGFSTSNVLKKIIKYLDKNDIVLDFGNSYFKNTYFNFLIIKKKFNLINTAISGGSEGALNGLCIMIDGNFFLLKKIFFFFKIISIKFLTRYSFSISLGIGSAHYLKMIHNAIEYGILQIISEIFFLFKILLKKKQIINLLILWNKNINLYLIKTMINILLKKKKKIFDLINQKGTGMWNCLNCIKNNININSILEALVIRIISNNILLRNLFIKKNFFYINCNLTIFFLKFKKTFLICIFFCYLQGFNQMIKIKKKYNWYYNYNNILKSYLNSCIINSNIIYYLINNKKFFFINKFLILIRKNFNIYKYIFMFLINCEILNFSMLSCFNFINIILNKNYNFKIIQLQRNYFGNHLIKFI